ncbi:MAG TPA: hypothetical protein VEL47_01910 [Myxococcota bacterium]|nr:hypothetical protein [Myxococcota bacterium]
MLRLIIATPWFMALIGCGHQGVRLSVLEERSYLEAKVARVSLELSDMGFFFDISGVGIDIKNQQDMSAMFNQISKDSKRGENSAVPFGPKKKGSRTGNGVSRRLAFYDPNSKTIVFLQGAIDHLTDGYLAHELAHVYQDQQWGFNQIWRPYQDNPSRELFNITQFIIEGHAELVREAYEQTHATDSLTRLSLSTRLGEISEDHCVVCHFKESTANLPYSLGMRFLLENFRNGGWPVVEGFLERLPSSTEQIIHPNKHKRDEPTSLKLPIWKEDPHTRLILNGSLGEAFLLSKLIEMGVDKKLAFEASSGWDGDVAQLYKMKDGTEVLLWRILFDRPQDAVQLVAAVTPVAKKKDDVLRIGRVVDWIISENKDVVKNLRVFLSKNAISFEPDTEDEKSTLRQEIMLRKDLMQLPSAYSLKKIILGPKFQPID